MALYVGLCGYPSRAMAARLTCFDTGWRFEAAAFSGPSKMNFAPGGVTGLLFG
jgi:hypothetical protein